MKNLFTFIFLIILSFNGHSQDITTYPHNDDTFGKKMIKDHDEGYVLLRSTWETQFGNSKYRLLRISEQGDSIFDMTFGSDNFNTPETIELSNDNGYIVGGNYREKSGEDIDAVVFKISRDGDIIWTKNYSKSKQGGRIYDIKPFNDTSYVLFGDIQTNTSYELRSGLIILINENGDEIWRKIIGTGQGLISIKTGEVGDTCIYAGGLSKNLNKLTATAYQLDFQGNINWSKQYPQRQEINNIQYTREVNISNSILDQNGFHLLGSIGLSPSNANSDNLKNNCLLLRIDEYGNLVDSVNYGSSNKESSYKIIQTLDYGYAITGNYNGPTSQKSSTTVPFFLKLNQDLDSLKFKIIDSTSSIESFDIIQNDDSIYVLFGDIRKGGSFSSKYHFMTMYLEKSIDSVIIEKDSVYTKSNTHFDKKYKIWPNPSIDGQINFQSMEKIKYEIKLLNGQMIQNGSLTDFKTINLDLPQGPYIINIESTTSRKRHLMINLSN